MILCFITTFSAVSFAAQLPISVVVDETKINFPDAQPFIDSNGRTQTPAKYIAEGLGATVSWNGTERKAEFTLKNKILVLYIGKSDYVINGETKHMDTTAIIKDDRTFVPAKYIVEAFGADINWDGSKRTVFVNTIKAPVPEEPAIDQSNNESNNQSNNENIGGEDDSNVIVEKPVKADLSYVSNFDRIYFSLKGIQLASVSSSITKYFTDEYDYENNRYIMTIPASSSINLADETFNINDSLVDTVNIFRDQDTGDTKIEFKTRKQFKFYTTYNEKRGQTEINLLEPAKEDERLVVIDAGHGGLDPGATNNSVNEKDLNLAIALKLEKLLENNNVKTYMLRQDDTFVGLYDRPYIANELNATLFLSIHNNSIDNTSVRGTETLYYPEKDGDTSFTGEKFAKLIQDSIINKISTVNRKTVERPGLVVLKYTKMPASLVEVGFLTNATDLSNLQNQTFQQKTAEALCDAILTSLGKIEAEKQAFKVSEQ